jgi:hypothetical protein
MVEPITPSEVLSRFIMQTNWYKPSDNCVRYAAFMPNPKNLYTEFQVFQVERFGRLATVKWGSKEINQYWDELI